MESTKTLLLAEFFTAKGYLERLLFAFTEMEKLHVTPRGKMQIQKICQESSAFICQRFPNLEFSAEDYIFETSEYKNHIKNFHNFIESIIKLPLSSDKTQKNIIDYINLIYRCCFELHQFLSESTHLEIQLPRTGLTKEEDIPTIKNSEAKNIPLFFLEYETIQELSKNTKIINSPIAFLELKREERYDHFVHRGHFFIAQKNYEEARSQFYKARNYKETAEVLTLLGWTYSLLEDIPKAKAYCLKAIQIDSQYGPAYNDMGNYILNEGNIRESLRWFELAKRAHNYQNREYPYINAGRAYILLKQYEDGLREFSLALTLAPHHEELHETIKKLKMNLAEEKERSQTTSNETLSQ